MLNKSAVEAAMEEAGWKSEGFGSRRIWKRGRLAAECGDHNVWEVWGQDGWAVYRGIGMPDEYLAAKEEVEKVKRDE